MGDLPPSAVRIVAVLLGAANSRLRVVGDDHIETLGMELLRGVLQRFSVSAAKPILSRFGRAIVARISGFRTSRTSRYSWPDGLFELSRRFGFGSEVGNGRRHDQRVGTERGLLNRVVHLGGSVDLDQRGAVRWPQSVSPEISVTSAPAAIAAAARAYPMAPLERLPMYRTGSRGSRVPPAVMTIFLPASRVDRRNMSLTVGHDRFRTCHAAFTDCPGRESSMLGIHDSRAALSERRQVLLRGWMVEHALFHRRGNDYRGGSREGNQT